MKRRVRSRPEASHPSNKRAKSEALPSSTGKDGKVKGKKAKNESNGLSFPEKLMQIMEHSEYWDAIKWSSDGCAFGINPEPFTEKIIDTHFQGGLFESMQKRLSRWGFQRVPMHLEFTGNWIAYHHVLFKRGKPELFQNLLSTEMLNIMAKNKEESALVTARRTSHPQLPRDASRPTALNSDDNEATCTFPQAASVNNSWSLQHPLSMNFVHAQNLSRLNVGDISSNSTGLLPVNSHQANLLPLQQAQLLRYLQQVRDLSITRNASSNPLLNLSRVGPLTQPWVDNERMLPLLSIIRSNALDELRVASLTDEQLLELYLRSRQL